MGRGRRALAAVAILAALAAASNAAAPRAAAEGELVGDLPVAGGFALVSWSGGPAEALAGAARSRGCNVRSVYANAPGDGLVGYVPAAQAAAANRAFLAAYPDGLPASPVFVVCGEPAPPRLVFLGDVSGERRAAIREEVADVVRFYAERFGVAVGESTLYVSPDGDAAAAVYRELTGGEYPVFTGEGGVVTDAPEAGILAFVSGQLVNSESDVFRYVMAHEYYHMIQRDILRAGGGSYSSPHWLVEGTATYSEYLYHEALRGVIYLQQQAERVSGVYIDQAWILESLGMEDATFRDVALHFDIGHYGLAASAIKWLVDASGKPSSHIEYWQALASGLNWESAFAAAFGMTVDDFFESFEQYRSDILAATPRISGIVSDLDGAPLRGVPVQFNMYKYVDVHYDNGHVLAQPHSVWSIYGTTSAAGKFDLPAPDGRYILRLGWRPSHLQNPSYDVAIYTFAYDTLTGYGNICSDREDVGEHEIVIAGRDVSGIVVTIARDLLTSTREPHCNEGLPGFHRIDGVVLGPGGEPIHSDWPDRPWVYIIQDNTPFPYWEQLSVESDGTFAAAVPDGSYVLAIGWYGDNGFAAVRSEATTIEVGGEDAQVIEVGGEDTQVKLRLHGAPSDLPTTDWVLPDVPGRLIPDATVCFILKDC